MTTAIVLFIVALTLSLAAGFISAWFLVPIIAISVTLVAAALLDT